MMTRARPLFSLLALVLWAALPGTAAAQANPFTPAIRVNEKVITQYELTQRTLFFEVLRAPGDPAELARERLIEERLQQQAADAAGITVTEQEIEAGLEEFAARANLTADQFIQAIAPAGVAEQTFRDFVAAGIAWRKVVRARFGPQTQITATDIDRAIAQGPGNDGSGVRVLISEIFLPADTPERQAAAQRRAAEIAQITTIPAFAAAARRYSAAPSRDRGGRQDWVPLGNLPPALRSQILTLAPGEVTDPIPVPNAIALFQLRAIEETGAPAQTAQSVEFARYYIPGGRTRAALEQAARIAARVDTCDDLYGIARGQPARQLQRDTLPLDQIAGDVAVELARLDPGEVSTRLTTPDGRALVFLMLCDRKAAGAETADRDQIRQGIFNQRLGALASAYLAELRADAVIQRLR